MDVASIIGIVNQKGGTGKTTSCINLGVDMAHEGKRVLLVDCDPQASLTISMGHPQPDALSVTLPHLIVYRFFLVRILRRKPFRVHVLFNDTTEKKKT